MRMRLIHKHFRFKTSIMISFGAAALSTGCRTCEIKQGLLQLRTSTNLKGCIMSSNECYIEHAVTLPSESLIANLYESAYLADAYAITLSPNASKDPKEIALFMFSQQKPWVVKLMGVRDYIVSFWGLKTAKKLIKENATERVHFFKIYQQFNNEIILGEDDKHLDFRISVLIRPQIADLENVFELVVTTVVHCHNLWGRSYIKIIKPFHERVVRSTIRQAARIGWPLHE